LVATADDVAETILANVVLDVTLTIFVTVLVFSLGRTEPAFNVVVEPLLDDLEALGGMISVPFTFSFEPDTESSSPEAEPKFAAPAVDRLGNDDGVLPPPPKPPLKPPPPAALEPAPPKPAAPKPAAPKPVHADETGWVIVTDRAVTVPDLAAVPVAEMHSPEASELKETGMLWVITVDDVIVTATWPLVGFCTSSVSVPTTAATVPEAVLKSEREVGVVGAPAAPAATAATAAKKLAGTTQTSPTTDTAPSTRTTRRRERARRRPDIRFAEPYGLGLIITTP
jgi:hypothetical protein